MGLASGESVIDSVSNFHSMLIFNECVYLSGVQIIFRRLTKVVATSKFWLKLTDVKCYSRKYRVLSRISIICGKF